MWSFITNGAVEMSFKDFPSLTSAEDEEWIADQSDIESSEPAFEMEHT